MIYLTDIKSPNVTRLCLHVAPCSDGVRAGGITSATPVPLTQSGRRRGETHVVSYPWGYAHMPISVLRFRIPEGSTQAES